jgi:hypothetical protein
VLDEFIRIYASEINNSIHDRPEVFSTEEKATFSRLFNNININNGTLTLRDLVYSEAHSNSSLYNKLRDYVRKYRSEIFTKNKDKFREVLKSNHTHGSRDIHDIFGGKRRKTTRQRKVTKQKKRRGRKTKRSMFSW